MSSSCTGAEQSNCQKGIAISVRAEDERLEHRPICRSSLVRRRNLKQPKRAPTMADDVSKDSIPRLTQTSQSTQGSWADRSEIANSPRRGQSPCGDVSGPVSSKHVSEPHDSDDRVLAIVSCETPLMCLPGCPQETQHAQSATLAQSHRQRSIALSLRPFWVRRCCNTVLLLVSCCDAVAYNSSKGCRPSHQPLYHGSIQDFHKHV